MRGRRRWSSSRTGSSLSPVQPGLTYEAAFLFEQDGSVAPPTGATVLLQRHTWRSSSLGPTVAWWDPTTALRGELDVREARSDADEEELRERPGVTAPTHLTSRRSRAQTLGAGAAVLAALAVGHVVVTAFPIDERVSGAVPPVDRRRRARRATVRASPRPRARRLTVLEPASALCWSTPGVWPRPAPRSRRPGSRGWSDSRSSSVGTVGRTRSRPAAARRSRPARLSPACLVTPPWAVEVPPEALPGAHLRIGLEQKDQRRDDVADIDLGLTQADADAWASDDSPVGRLSRGPTSRRSSREHPDRHAGIRRARPRVVAPQPVGARRAAGRAGTHARRRGRPRPHAVVGPGPPRPDHGRGRHER